MARFRCLLCARHNFELHRTPLGFFATSALLGFLSSIRFVCFCNCIPMKIYKSAVTLLNVQAVVTGIDSSNIKNEDLQQCFPDRGTGSRATLKEVYTWRNAELSWCGINGSDIRTEVLSTSTAAVCVCCWCDKHVLSRLQSSGAQALTLSPPIPLRLYTLPSRSNPPCLIFDIRALWRSVLSPRAPECQKLKMVG